MKTFDYILRNWRYRIAESYVTNVSDMLDIGGYDGSFLRRVNDRIKKGICIDPLSEDKKEGKLVFIKSRIGDKLPFSDNSFEIVSMLAVYEHLGQHRKTITLEVFRILKPHGIALLTIPSRAVDYIIKVLLKIKLVDAISFEEHDHFKSSDVIQIFEGCGFRLKHRSRFQFGLNNLFIFEKKDIVCSCDNIQQDKIFSQSVF